MVTLLDVAHWLELKNVVAMAGKVGLSRPISVRDLIRIVVQQAPRIEHVFVLMLENRSFDHMLGFAGISGKDAVTAQPTTAIDLTVFSLRAVARALDRTTVLAMAGSRGLKSPISVRELVLSIHSNVAEGKRIFASNLADFAAEKDPGHEFEDVLVQLCGYDALPYPVPEGYPVGGGITPKLPTRLGGPYPLITNKGFAAKYPETMKCYAHPEPPLGPPLGKLPVLVQLAKEFALCDRWFSSMPGPTWPNRFFMHAASSAGLDDSPSDFDKGWAELIKGYSFHNGTIFDRLEARNLAWAIFQGDDFPITRALAGLDDDNFYDFDEFEAAVNDPKFAFAYTFIEPDYGSIWSGTFTCGNSQHPKDDVTRGEKLIKRVYDIIRNSPNWFKSVLLITYDEHGGFFDHVPPPGTVAPGDGLYYSKLSDGDVGLYILAGKNGFDFTQLGVRVPAIVISPRIARGTIDHTIYDHTSLLATVEKLFGLDPLTNRDRNANSFNHLFSLGLPRKDTPALLFPAANSGLVCQSDLDGQPASPTFGQTNQQAPQDEPLKPLLRGFMYVAFLRHYRVASTEEKSALVEEFVKIRTEREAHDFMQRVRLKLQSPH